MCTSVQVDTTSLTNLLTGQPAVIKAMKQDTVIKRQWMGMKRPQVGGGKRGKITKLSKPSLRRMKLQFRNMPDPTHMITLTYPAFHTNDGAAVKRNFTAIKKWLIRHGVTSGAWFLEFQKRGAPHFHMFVNASVDVVDLASAWMRIVFPTISDIKTTNEQELLEAIQRGMKWHIGGILKGKDKAGNVCTNRPCIEPLRVTHAASAYATSYAAKAEQKRVPSSYQNVGRFWGAWGDYRNKDVEEHGFRVESADIPSYEEVELLAVTRTIRSIRGLLKSRGYVVKDGGHYGFVAWGVSNDTIRALMSYYRAEALESL